MRVLAITLALAALTAALPNPAPEAADEQPTPGGPEPLVKATYTERPCDAIVGCWPLRVCINHSCCRDPHYQCTHGSRCVEVEGRGFHCTPKLPWWRDPPDAV